MHRHASAPPLTRQMRPMMSMARFWAAAFRMAPVRNQRPPAVIVTVRPCRQQRVGECVCDEGHSIAGQERSHAKPTHCSLRQPARPPACSPARPPTHPPAHLAARDPGSHGRHEKGPEEERGGEERQSLVVISAVWIGAAFGSLLRLVDAGEDCGRQAFGVPSGLGLTMGPGGGVGWGGNRGEPLAGKDGAGGECASGHGCKWVHSAHRDGRGGLTFLQEAGHALDAARDALQWWRKQGSVCGWPIESSMRSQQTLAAGPLRGLASSTALTRS